MTERAPEPKPSVRVGGAVGPSLSWRRAAKELGASTLFSTTMLGAIFALGWAVTEAIVYLDGKSLRSGAVSELALSWLILSLLLALLGTLEIFGRVAAARRTHKASRTEAAGVGTVRDGERATVTGRVEGPGEVRAPFADRPCSAWVAELFVRNGDRSNAEKVGTLGGIEACDLVDDDARVAIFGGETTAVQLSLWKRVKEVSSATLEQIRQFGVEPEEGRKYFIREAHILPGDYVTVSGVGRAVSIPDDAYRDAGYALHLVGDEQNAVEVYEGIEAPSGRRQPVRVETFSSEEESIAMEVPAQEAARRRETREEA